MLAAKMSKTTEMKPDEKSGLSPKHPSKKSYSVLQWTGFTKTSSIVFFLLTAGVFAVFSAFNLVAELPEGFWIKPNPPGIVFAFKDGLLKLGMQIHLYTVLRKSSSKPKTTC